MQNKGFTRPQLIVKKQAQVVKRKVHALHAEYQQGEGVKKAARKRAMALSQLNVQESDTPPEMEGKHENKITMYKELRRYLCEVMNRIIDKNARQKLEQGLDYHNPLWAWNDPSKNRRLALHAFAYLAEMNIEIPASVIQKIKKYLTHDLNNLHRNAIEYALLSYSFLLIHNKIPINKENLAAIQKGLDLLILQARDNVSYYPALIAAILAKAIAQCDLSHAEILILQKACAFFEERQDFDRFPKLFANVAQNANYTKDPWLWYTKNPEYYKKKAIWGSGEVGHVIATLDSGKIADEVEQCKYTHALLNSVVSGQQIPEQHQKTLLEFFKARNHHKTEFYSYMLLGVLICSNKVQVKPSELNQLTRKMHNMSSQWRGLALRAYYLYLSQQKSKNKIIKYDHLFKEIVEYWSVYDPKPMNKKYATLIQFLSGDASVLNKLSIEPEHVKSTLIIWIDSVEKRLQLPIDILQNIITIIKGFKNKYKNEDVELAMYLLSALLQQGAIEHKLVDAKALKNNEVNRAKLLEEAIKLIVGFLGEANSLLVPALDILEYYTLNTCDRKIFTDLLLNKILALAAKLDNNDVMIKVIAIFDNLVMRGAKIDYELFFNNLLRRDNNEIVKVLNYCITNRNEQDAADVFNNCLLFIKDLTEQDYLLGATILAALARVLAESHLESEMHTIFSIFKVILERDAENGRYRANKLGIKSVLAGIVVALGNDNKSLSETASYLLCSYIGAIKQDKDLFDKQFFNLLNTEVLVSNKESSAIHPLYYGVDLLRCLAENGYIIPVDSLHIINRIFSQGDHYLKSSIIYIDTLVYEKYPSYDEKVLLYLQDFEQEDTSILEDQIKVIALLVGAENAPGKLHSVTHETCVTLSDIFNDSNQGSSLRSASLNALAQISGKKMLPDGIITEFTDALANSDLDHKSKILQLIDSQIKAFKVIPNNMEDNEDYHKLIKNIENCIYIESLLEPAISILNEFNAQKYKLSTACLDGLASIVFYHPNSLVRGIAYQIIRRHPLVELSSKVQEVYQQENIASQLVKKPTKEDVEAIEMLVQQGKQLTAGMLEALDVHMQDGLKRLIFENAQYKVLAIITKLVEQRNDVSVKWSKPLMSLIKVNGKSAHPAANALSLLLVNQSINLVEPYIAVINYVNLLSIKNINTNMLKAIHYGLKTLAFSHANKELLELLSALFRIMQNYQELSDELLNHTAMLISEFGSFMPAVLVKNNDIFNLWLNTAKLHLTKSSHYQASLSLLKAMVALNKKSWVPTKFSELHQIMVEVKEIVDNHHLIFDAQISISNRFASIHKISKYPIIQAAVDVVEEMSQWVENAHVNPSVKIQILTFMSEFVTEKNCSDNCLLSLIKNIHQPWVRTGITQVVLKVTRCLKRQPKISVMQSAFELMLSETKIQGCYDFAQIICEIAKRFNAYKESISYKIARFYLDLLKSADENFEQLLGKADHDILNNVPNAVVDFIFNKYIDNKLSAAAFKEFYNDMRANVSLSAKNKLLQLCYENPAHEVSKMIFCDMAPFATKKFVETAKFSVEPLTAVHMDFLTILIKCSEYKPEAKLIKAAFDVLAKSTDVTYITSAIQFLDALYDQGFVDTEKFKLDAIFELLFKAKLPLQNDIKNLALKTVFKEYSLNKASIKNIDLVIKLLMDNTPEKLKSEVSPLAKEMQLWSLLAAHANFALFDNQELSKNFQKSIEDKLLARLQTLVEDDVLQKFIQKYRMMYAMNSDKFLILLDVIANNITAFEWSDSEINTLLILLEYDICRENGGIDALLFVRKCGKSIRLAWFRELLSLCKVNLSSEDVSLNDAANLVGQIGFSAKNFYNSFFKTVLLPEESSNNVLRVSRLEVVNFLRSVQELQLEAHFINVVLPRFNKISVKSPLLEMTKNLQQYWIFAKLLKILSLIEDKKIPQPMVEDIINLSELTQKIYVNIEKNLWSFGHVKLQLESYESAANRFISAADFNIHDGEVDKFLNFPNMIRLQFAIDMHVDYHLTTLDLSISISELQSLCVAKHFGGKPSKLSLDDLGEALIRENHEGLKSLVSRIKEVILNVRTLYGQNQRGLGPISEWSEQSIKSWSSSLTNAKELDDAALAQRLAVIVRACKLTQDKDVRDAQLLAVLALWFTPKEAGRFLQVATGEGKSVIIAILSILNILSLHTLDLVTSSAILASRDAHEQKSFYGCFNILISHNEDDPNYTKGAKKCYAKENKALYGSASNFQFDILRHEYSLLSTLGDRQSDTIVIDEVDNLLIDEGSKIAMLANTMPFYSYLNPLLISLYKKLEQIDQQRLYLQDLDKASDDFSRAKEIRITELLTSHANKMMMEGSRDYILIPAHLKPYVREQIASWIKSAILAYYVYKENHHYIISVDENFIDRITPVDYANTGITQSGTTWGDGLQQFLEIKHGLRISSESVITNYLSNVAFIKRYIKTSNNNINNRIFGLTGTLGSDDSKQLLAEIYKIDFINIPSFMTRRFVELHHKLCDDENSWLANIVLEAVREASSGRIVLLLSETIAKAKLIKRFIKNYKGDINLVKYITSNRSSTIFSEKYQPKTIILATNLAGRGTDIKLDPAIVRRGGLHVVFTFLPDNLRVQRQGFGRAGRGGEPGTGKFILNRMDVIDKLGILAGIDEAIVAASSIDTILAKRDELESKLLTQIRKNELPVIENKDYCFKKYCELRANNLENFHTGIIPKKDYNWFGHDDTETIKDALEELWGLWLQGMDFSKISHAKTISTFQEFADKAVKEIKNYNIIKNPCYYINLGNAIAKQLDSLWLKTVSIYKKSRFLKYADACYQKAIDADKLFAFIAYYNQSYIKILIGEKNFKSQALNDLNNSEVILTNLAKQLRITQEIYSNNKSQGTSGDLSVQLDQEAQVFSLMFSSISAAKFAIENQDKCLSPIVVTEGAVNVFHSMIKNEVLGLLEKSNEESKIAIRYHDLHPRHDMCVKNSSERHIAVVDERALIDFQFDASQLPVQVSLSYTMRKLLPINRYLSKAKEEKEINAKLAEQDKVHETAAGGKIKKGAKAVIQAPGKLINIIDQGFHFVVNKVTDLFKDRDTEKKIPVNLSYQNIIPSQALYVVGKFAELIKGFKQTYVSPDNTSMPEPILRLTFDDLSFLQAQDCVQAYKGYEKHLLQQKLKRPDHIAYVVVKNSDNMKSPASNEPCFYKLSLDYRNLDALTDSLKINADNILPFNLSLNNLLQPFADVQIRNIDLPLVLSFNDITLKSAKAIADYCDNALYAAKMTVKSLNKQSAQALVTNSEASTRKYGATQRLIEVELLDHGFEKADIYPFTLNGFVMFYHTYQKQPRPIFRIILAITLGVIQIVAGAVLTVFTTGFGAAVGGVLIAEGIIDIFGAIKGAWTGQYSYDGYVGNKVFNVGLGIAFAGIGSGVAYLASLKKAAAASAQAGAVAIEELGKNAAKVAVQEGAILAGEATASSASQVAKVSWATKLKSLFSAANIRTMAINTAKVGARKVVLTGSSAAMGAGAELISNHHKAKVGSQMRSLIKAQINSPHSKANLTKVLAYDRLLNTRSHYNLLANTIEKRMNKFNFLLLGAGGDSINIAFENAFGNSCEEVANGLLFEQLLVFKLGKGLRSQDLADIIQVLKDNLILRNDEMIDIEALLPDVTVIPDKAPDFANSTIDFGALSDLKPAILKVCFELYQASQLSYFSEKNSLMKRFSANITEAMVEELSMAMAIGQMVAGTAVGIGYSILEGNVIAKLNSKFEDADAISKGAKVEKIDKEYLLSSAKEEEGGIWSEKLKLMKAVKKIVYPEATNSAGESFIREKIFFENGATYTRDLKPNFAEDLNAAQFYMRDGAAQLLMNPKDIALLEKGYNLVAKDYNIIRANAETWQQHDNAAVLSKFRENNNEFARTFGYAEAHDSNLTKVVEIFNTQFFYDQASARYVEVTRDALQRHLENENVKDFGLVRGKHDKVVLQAKNANIAIPVVENQFEKNNRFLTFDFWNDIADIMFSMKNSNDLNDTPNQNDVAQLSAYDEYVSLVKISEKVKSQRLNADNSRNIIYECFLQRVSQASITVFRHVTLKNVTRQALLMQINYYESLYTLNNSYYDAALYIIYTIKILMLMIISNISKLDQVESIDDEEQYLKQIQNDVEKAFHLSMLGGYAEESYAIFRSELNSAGRKYDNLEEFMQLLKSKFDDYHDLRLQIDILETQFNNPSVSDTLFSGMKRSQLDNAIKSYSGMMFAGKFNKVGVLFRKSVSTPIGAVVGAILGTFKINSENSQYARSKLERFMKKLIVDVHNHQAKIYAAIQNNEAAINATKLENVRAAAEEISTLGDKYKTVIAKLATEKEVMVELKELDNMRNKLMTIIKQYMALINKLGKGGLTSYDYQLLNYTKAKYLIASSVDFINKNFEDIDLYKNLREILLPKQDSVSSKNKQPAHPEAKKLAQNKSVNEGVDSSPQEPEVFHPRVDFRRCDYLRVANAKALYENAESIVSQKMALLLEYPDAISCLAKRQAKFPALSPVEILQLDISTLTKSLLLNKTLSRYCYEKEVFTNKDNVISYLGFATRFGLQGVISILGITRHELVGIIMNNLHSKIQETTDKVKSVLRLSISQFMQTHVELGCNFEKIFRNLVYPKQVELILEYDSQWHDKDVVSRNIEKLMQLLLIEHRNHQDKFTLEEAYQWNTNHNIRSNISLLEKHVENATILHDMRLLCRDIESRLQNALDQLVGKNSDAKLQRRLNILLGINSKQPWINIPEKLVWAFAKEKNWKVSQTKRNMVSQSVAEVLNDNVILESYLKSYLGMPYAEIDKDIFNLVINLVGIKISLLDKPIESSRLNQNFKNQVIIAPRVNSDEWLVLCACNKEDVKLYDDLNLPLGMMAIDDSIYQLRSAVKLQPRADDINKSSTAKKPFKTVTKSFANAGATPASTPASTNARPVQLKPKKAVVASKFFKSAPAFAPPKKVAVKSWAGSNQAQSKQASMPKMMIDAPQIKIKMQDPTYWYSIYDGVLLLQNIRKKLNIIGGNHDEMYGPYCQNLNRIFLTDPYHQSNFSNYFNDDIQRITAQGEFSNIKPWSVMPKVILIPILCNAHWVFVRVDINYENHSLQIYWSDPFGRHGLIQNYTNLFKDSLISGCLQMINYLRPYKPISLDKLKITHKHNEIDQQGYQINGTDCGVITFSNIADSVLNQNMTIPVHTSAHHRDLIKKQRILDSHIVGGQEVKEEAGLSRIKLIEQDQAKIRSDRLDTSKLQDEDAYILEEIKDLNPLFIDIFITFLDTYHDLNVAYSKFTEIFQADYAGQLECN